LEAHIKKKWDRSSYCNDENNPWAEDEDSIKKDQDQLREEWQAVRTFTLIFLPPLRAGGSLLFAANSK
jgi:hypothetical protein